MESKLENHEERITKLEVGATSLKVDVAELARELRENSTRVEASNQFLRELSLQQSGQNTEILQAVLDRNVQSDKRAQEMQLLDKQNWWKLAFIVGGSGGVVAVLFELAINLVKGGN